jgi:serine/threonine protein phosphatase PrpC
MQLKKYAAITDQGPYLNLNEDSYLYDLASKLFIVADGFGGSGIGDQQTQSTIANIKEFYGKLCDDLDSTMPFYYNQNNLIEANGLMNSLFHSHRLAWESNKDRPLNERGACSVLAMCQSDSVLISFCIGNIKQYLVRGKKIYPVHNGQVYQYMSRNSFDSHLGQFPMSALGMYPEFEYEKKEIRVREGDLIVLATDGAVGQMPEGEILQVLDQEQDIYERSLELLKRSNEKGNLDNQTILVLQY